MKLKISDEHDSLTVRSYLSSVIGISRGELTSLKAKEDGIILNGKRVTVRAALHSGDILELNRSDESGSSGILPVELPLDIIYEDDDIIALNKPPFTPTHPSYEHQTDTLANALAFYYASKEIPFVFRAVNRLDKDTSGIVIVAKNRASAFYMSRQISEFKVEKKYIALACGHIDRDFSVEANMVRSENSKMKRIICSNEQGQYSRTDFTSIGTYNGYTALYALPKTGRTHQIRLHLSHVGHPILGDTLYGCEEGSPLIGRQALHAYSLVFVRQSDGKLITLTAPLPDDISNLLNNKELL